MPKTQRQKLTELLEQQQSNGVIRSDNELKRELERLMTQLEDRDGTPTFQAIEQSERTNSATYNQNLDSLSFDLETIFSSSNNIERLIKSHHQLSRSSIAEIRKQIADMRSQVEYFKLLMEADDGLGEGIYEDFFTEKLTETREEILSVMRKDRFGETRGSVYEAENVGNALQLSGYETTNQVRTNYGRQIADIKVRNRVGLEAENTQHPVELAIDGSPNTFWAESVLVDDVILQNIGDIWSHDYHDFPKSGALSELEITLNGLSTVSELRFDPYASYPLEIVSIHGYENKSRTGEMYELVSPTHTSTHQRSQKSVDRMIFQFPSVEISMIRILVRQENYTKENFLINEDELRDSQLWENLTNTPELIADYAEPGETVASFDKKNEVAGWNVYLNKLKEWAEIFKEDGLVDAAKRAMEVVRIGDYKNPLLLSLYALKNKGEKTKVVDERSPTLESQWKPVNKLSYLYGAYDISVYGRKYNRSSIYVSQELPLSSNIETMAITTDEKHHYISVGPDEVDPQTNMPILNSSKITDIEYYITDKKNPIPTDWKPLLPTNNKYVESELLLGDDGTEPCEALQDGNTINFSLRFPFISKNTLVLKRNGVAMRPDMYLLCDDSKKIGIKNEHYSPTSIYTADYKPDETAYVVNLKEDNNITPTQFIDKKGEIGESFKSSDQHNRITLSHMPYLHREFLYNYQDATGRYEDDKDVLKASQFTYPLIVRVEGEEYKNITDYTSNTYDPERLNENNGKSFAHIKNQIFFGNPTDGTTIQNVTIDYYYITTSIRLKAILRRNHASYESVTPALFNYKIKTQSYDQDR